MAKRKPGEFLLPYQSRWASDVSRWKFGLMARQVGKDFSSGAEGIADIHYCETRKKKTTWLIAAPSERQSLESLEKWKEWAQLCKLAIAEIKDTREGGADSLLKSTSIIFPNGSRVIAVPGKPDTVRGYSANILLTEFAYFEDPGATWRAILPSITNPLRGGLKKVRLITTPNGIGNKTHEIWEKNHKPICVAENVQENRPSTGTSPVGAAGLGLWSCHFVDIYTAVKEGLKIDVEELKGAIDDPECWAQEYECQFLDTQSILLSYELIAMCESQEAYSAAAPEFWQSQPGFPIFMGIDFGRRRDLSVAWSLGQQGDVARTVEVLEMEALSTPEQVERLRPRLQRAQRACLDYTGPGIGMGDYLTKEFGEWNPSQHKYGKIELCTFTNALKVELFSKMRMAFERRGVRVPVSRVIREDLHSMSRVTTATGQISYRASHTADGHADRSTALALALRAAGSGGAPVAYSRVGTGAGIDLTGLGRGSTGVYL